MKRLYKFVALVTAMTMLFAVPVLAAEDRALTTISSESTDDLVRQLDAYNARTMGYVLYVGNFNAFAQPYGNHAMLVSKQVKDYDILCCNNHMLYLNNVLSAATTDLANKQTQCNYVASQAASNATYASLLPQCQADVAAAQQKVADTQNKIALANQKLAKYYDANVF